MVSCPGEIIIHGGKSLYREVAALQMSRATLLQDLSGDAKANGYLTKFPPRPASCRERMHEARFLLRCMMIFCQMQRLFLKKSKKT